MFRQYLTKFWLKHKEKLQHLGKVSFIAFVAIIMMIALISNLSNFSFNYEQPSRTYNPTYSIVTSNYLDEAEYKENNTVVDKFIDFCNNNNYESAYELLSDECKKELYPSLTDFEEKYCKKYFSSKKQYNLQSWVNGEEYNTYKIRIIDDLLVTGDYSDSKKYEDYITINDEGKININGYIKNEKIDKAIEKDGIKIYIDEVNIYMDYEEYDINVTNNTDNKILLDTLKNNKRTLNVISSSNNIYPIMDMSYLDIMVNAKESKTISLKFDKDYALLDTSAYIQFSQIISNYSEFIKDKENYNQIISIDMSI